MNKPLNELTPDDVTKTINTHNVDLSREDYAKTLVAAKTNADMVAEQNENIEREAARISGKKYVAPKNKKAPISEELRHQRILSNFCGTMINMVLPVYQFVAEMLPVVYAIADKLGIDIEQVKTAEEKAYEAAAEVLKAKKFKQENK